MKRIIINVLLTFAFVSALPSWAQGYNQEKTALANFLVRMYENAPFDGVKAVEQLEKFFSQEIAIKRSKNGGGKITIGFADDKDIERFIERFNSRS